MHPPRLRPARRLVRPAVLCAFALLVTSASVRGAFAADGHVPDVPADSLPVAGTCAPIPSTDATIVTVGDVGWYRVSGRGGEVDYPTLASILAERAGVPQDGASVSRHSVWVVADAEQPLRPVLNVLILCSTTGIFRAGLQVRSESGEGVMGFPLFLPPRASAEAGAAPTGKARRLEVKVEANAKDPSDPRLLYEAAHRAVERFGTVVADVSVHGAVKLQDAVTSLDMLWRGGVAGVRLSWRGLPPRWQGLPGLKLVVQGRDVAPPGTPVEVPAIRARKQPWPDDGAAQPGALSFDLEDLPGAIAAEPSGGTPDGPRRFPNYARLPGGPPPDVRLQAEGLLLGWARDVAKDLGLATRGTLPPAGRLVVREGRDPVTAARLLAPARTTFPGAERLYASTLHVPVYLFLGTKVAGRVDVTLHLAGSAVSVVFASWVAETFPEGLILPPEPVDPYAAGVAGALRVTLEGILAAAKREGLPGVPLAPDAEVLQLLPQVAHAGVTSRLAARAAQVENLGGWLRATPYDRILLTPPDGTVAVWSRGRVEGILRFGAEPEESDLRLNGIVAKSAPR